MFRREPLKLVKHGFAFTGVEVAIMIVGMLVALRYRFCHQILMQYIKNTISKPSAGTVSYSVIVLLYSVIKTVILKA